MPPRSHPPSEFVCEGFHGIFSAAEVVFQGFHGVDGAPGFVCMGLHGVDSAAAVVSEGLIPSPQRRYGFEITNRGEASYSVSNTPAELFALTIGCRKLEKIGQ